MFDTDKFIESVHANPALWDKGIEQYSDRNEREKCWVIIAQSMFSDWSEIDVKEKDLKLKDMKNKWRHIRDNFLKYINISKSGTPAPSKKKKYVYAEALTFLLNSIQKRQTSGSIASVDDLNDSDDRNDVTNVVEEEATTAEATTAPALSQDNFARKTKTISPFHSQFLTQLSLSSKAEEDPDRLYIMSLLRDFKKLMEDEKLNFKCSNLQFFRSVQQRKAQSLAQNVPRGQPQTPSWNQPASAEVANTPQHQHPSYFMPGVPGPSNPHFPQEVRNTQTPPYSTAVFSPSDSIYSSDY